MWELGEKDEKNTDEARGGTAELQVEVGRGRGLRGRRGSVQNVTVERWKM